MKNIPTFICSSEYLLQDTKIVILNEFLIDL